MRAQGEKYLSLADYQQFAPSRDTSTVEQIRWTGHIHKYIWAVSQLTNLRSIGAVLDLGCGMGFGSDKLAGWAKRVVGADFNQEVIQYASERYGGANRHLSFCTADATKLPFQARHFAAVCSFELIEHLPEHMIDSYLTEIKRVLVPGGIVLLSTPNRAYREMIGVEMFPFHAREYTCQEFLAVLQPYFGEVQLFGQRYLRKPLQMIEQQVGHASLMRLKRAVPPGVKRVIASSLRWDRDPMSNWTIETDALERAYGLLAVCTVARA